MMFIRSLPKSFRNGAMLAMLLLGGAGVLLLRPGQTSTAGEDPQPSVYNPAETQWDDYLWPTDAGTIRTSDFAEFRKTHFHAGIDVSTGGQTGFKVFAARAGWVHSLSFEPGGYGWILVLRHYDGYYTSYAHLQGPTDAILEAWHTKLIASKRSFGEVVWDSDTIRVKRGEVIAYTGDTGAGPAHLHFEVRDKNYNPVNPGLSKNLRPADSLPPEVLGVMLVPLDASASIDGKWSAKQLTPAGSGSARTVRGVPVLRGRIGIMLRAHDRANGATDYPTPYRIRLYVDGKEYFTSTAQRFADTLGWHIRIDRDHQLMQNLKGEFRKLYREEGNLLEFYFPQAADAGVFSAEKLGGGRKAIKIVAEDLAGNKTTVLMNVALAFDIRLDISGDENELKLRLPSTSGCELLSLEDVSASNAHSLASWKAREAAAGVAVNLNKYRGKTLRIVSTDSSGQEQVQAEFSPGGASRAAGRLYTKRELQYDEIIYDLRMSAPFGTPPEVRLIQGDRSAKGRVFPIDATRYRAVLQAWEGLKGAVSVEVRYAVGPKFVTWTDTLSLFLISARKGGELHSADRKFTLKFSPGDVYRSILYTVERAGGDSLMEYRVTPSDIPLAGRPVASFVSAEAVKGNFISVQPPMRKYTEGSGSGGRGISANVGRFTGAYALKRDITGPTIAVDLARKSREPVRIVLRDSLSGIDLKTVIARIDGNIVPLHFDEGRFQLYVPADVFKKQNGKELSVTARDRAGNETAVSRSLR